MKIQYPDFKKIEEESESYMWKEADKYIGTRLKDINISACELDFKAGMLKAIEIIKEMNNTKTKIPTLPPDVE